METIYAYLDSLTKKEIRIVAEQLLEQMEEHDIVRYNEEDNYYYWEVNGEKIHEP